MDSTYTFALVIAFIVGVIAQIARLVRQARWTKFSGAVALAAALGANGALLLKWSHLLDWGLAFAFADLSFIALMSVIGFGAIAPGAILVMFRR